jgi:hypothetical protein
MRVYKIVHQTIEVYGYEEDEFEKFMEKFNFDFESRPYRPLKWWEKFLHSLHVMTYKFANARK